MIQKKVCNAIQQAAILDTYKAMMDFVTSFEGGKVDQESLETLQDVILQNEIALPTEVAENVHDFIGTVLEPMVYDFEEVFSDARSIGYMVDGVQHLDTERDLLEMCFYFYRKRNEIKDALKTFGKEELQPYLNYQPKYY